MSTIKTGTLFRHFSVNRGAIDIENRTAELAFSSEEPYRRWFGIEILDHNPASVRLDRLKNGGALLVDHNTGDQVGVVETANIESGKGRAVVRFGRSARAQEIFQDVQDDIRRHVSVGYIVREMVMEKSDEETETFRVIDWEPMEISIVAVPADPTVGVGRSHGMEIETVIKKSASEPEAMPVPVVDPVVLPDVPAVPMPEKAAVTETPPIVVTETQEPSPIINETKEANAMNIINLSEKETKQYSYTRALASALAQSEGKSVSGFEVEISETIDKSTPKEYKRNGGIFVPLSLQRAPISEALYDTTNKGDEIIFTQHGDLIELLRNASVAVALGARVLPDLIGPLAFPKKTGAATAYWMAENDGTDVTRSNLTLGTVTLSPKTLQASTPFSRQLLAQSSLNVEQLIREDLSESHALAWDLAVLHGSGNSNQPSGLYAVSGINSKAMGGVPTYGKLIDMVTEVNKDNALRGNSLAFVTTPGMAGKLAQTVIAASTDTRMIWDGKLTEGTMCGYSARSSNQVSAVLGGGNNEHGIIFGDWSQAMIGMWGSMELIVDPYTLKKQGMVEVTSFQMVDIQFRHENAFCKATGATIA